MFKLLGRSLLHVSHKQLEFFVRGTQKAQTGYTISLVLNWLISLIDTLALLLTALKRQEVINGRTYAAAGAEGRSQTEHRNGLLELHRLLAIFLS
jgi:hypothetical protein